MVRQPGSKPKQIQTYIYICKNIDDDFWDDVDVDDDVDVKG